MISATVILQAAIGASIFLMGVAIVSFILGIILYRIILIKVIELQQKGKLPRKKRLIFSVELWNFMLGLMFAIAFGSVIVALVASQIDLTVS